MIMIRAWYVRIGELKEFHIVLQKNNNDKTKPDRNKKEKEKGRKKKGT